MKRLPKLAAGAESGVQALIMAFIGLMAGRASFTHMHDWTMQESPAHTPGWFGWSNAVVSELIPVTALLDIRRKRRAGKPFSKMKFPIGVLVVSAGLSLAAQISQAKHSPSGWLVAALPAIGFLVVAKLVFSGHNTTDEEDQEQAGQPQNQPAAQATQSTQDSHTAGTISPHTTDRATEPAPEPDAEPEPAQPLFAPWARPAPQPARTNGNRPAVEVDA